MKNNRLTNEDVGKLRMACDRIRELASLEKANFSPFDEGKDIEVKKNVRPYMMWFEVVAQGIDEILDGREVPYSMFR